jgi:hypothetical protein
MFFLKIKRSKITVNVEVLPVNFMVKHVIMNNVSDSMILTRGKMVIRLKHVLI